MGNRPSAAALGTNQQLERSQQELDMQQTEESLQANRELERSKQELDRQQTEESLQVQRELERSKQELDKQPSFGANQQLNSQNRLDGKGSSLGSKPKDESSNCVRNVLLGATALAAIGWSYLKFWRKSFSWPFSRSRRRMMSKETNQNESENHVSTAQGATTMSTSPLEASQVEGTIGLDFYVTALALAALC